MPEVLTEIHKGDWCPYSEKPLFCQEGGGCLNCRVYLDSIQIPEDVSEVKEDDSDKG